MDEFQLISGGDEDLASDSGALQRAVIERPSLGQCCRNCTMRTVCWSDNRVLSSNLPAVSMNAHKVQRGQMVFRAGDTFQNIYFIRWGTVKVSLFHPKGDEQVISFPGAGNIFGLDGISMRRHTCEAIALEDSQVCAVPYLDAQARARDNPAVQQILSALVADEISRQCGLLLLLGRMTSEERLAAFLTAMSRRMASLGYSAIDFHLRMTRQDIGNHLGMKLETVSRTFSRLQEKALIEVNQKHIKIRDLPCLKTLAGEGA